MRKRLLQKVSREPRSKREREKTVVKTALVTRTIRCPWPGCGIPMSPRLHSRQGAAPSTRHTCSLHQCVVMVMMLVDVLPCCWLPLPCLHFDSYAAGEKEPARLSSSIWPDRPEARLPAGHSSIDELCKRFN
jgi:hypothetical protein